MTLLVIGTGGREYREYLLASIGSRYRVHLLLGEEPTWERAHIAGWTVLDSPGETVDAAEMVAAARAVAGPVRGVLSWDEARVLQTAKVAHALGLPGGDPDVAMRCRDKHLTRVALRAAGVPQPASVLVHGLKEALEAAEAIATRWSSSPGPSRPASASSSRAPRTTSPTGSGSPATPRCPEPGRTRRCWSRSTRPGPR